jgi:hypothetical protein
LDGLVSGAVGAILSGAPSTLYALLTGRPLLEATDAAGAILVGDDAGRIETLAAAAAVHGALSLGWGVVLARVLPRRRPVIEGVVAGLAIAALDLGVVGRRIPAIRRLPQLPQWADHIAYGVTVALVLRTRSEFTAPWRGEFRSRGTRGSGGTGGRRLRRPTRGPTP